MRRRRLGSLCLLELVVHSVCFAFGNQGVNHTSELKHRIERIWLQNHGFEEARCAAFKPNYLQPIQVSDGIVASEYWR